MKTDKVIKICSGGHDYEMPLIYTHAFPGAEYWCPYCSALYGILGAGEDVPFTWKLWNRYIKYKRLSKSYLRANSTLGCSRLKYKGEWIEPHELPEKSREYWIKKSKEWTYQS